MRMGEFIAAARQRHGLSQRDLSAMVGLANSKICEVETGKRSNLSWRNMVKLAYVLGLSLDELAALSTHETMDRALAAERQRRDE